ncbi:IS6 family transposase [Pandoraea sputorum]|uniref:IS6 family transposase n=1 Tax=Pandoraea sputorum TaxID=93222 RepID=UPI0012411868|nr:IS6 family transposase [Pandoraea sputorum]VVE59590.1 integrase [Pandoraea sputorum]
MKCAAKPLRKPLPAGIAKVLKRLHYPLEVILQCVRWYVAYSLRSRDLEETMAKRGVAVDHSTIPRWVIKLQPVFDKAIRGRLRPTGESWRMDETYIRVRGEWKCLYRAVDKAGHTIDFVLCARRFFEKATAGRGTPKTVTVDKSGANRAAMQAPNAQREIPIEIRQNKSLNNLVEQDHRAIKRRVKPMLGFQNFRCAHIVLGGIEAMHMIGKGQMLAPKARRASPAEQFYALAA